MIFCIICKYAVSPQCAFSNAISKLLSAKMILNRFCKNMVVHQCEPKKEKNIKLVKSSVANFCEKSYSHVNSQLRSLIESCSTLTTSKRFFLTVFGMSPHMVSNVAFKTFSTNVAFIKPFIFVKRKDVPFQSVSSWVSLVAQMTCEFSSTDVQFHVRFQIS